LLIVIDLKSKGIVPLSVHNAKNRLEIVKHAQNHKSCRPQIGGLAPHHTGSPEIVSLSSGYLSRADLACEVPIRQWADGMTKKGETAKLARGVPIRLWAHGMT
jgi:hypothetical protein